MECNKWHETGLLFTAREMDQSQADEFLGHLKSCNECSNEVDLYNHEKNKFFSYEILGESPSKTLDAKIISICSQKPKPTTGFNIFSGLWFKKALVSSLFLVFGIGSGIYFTVNYTTTNTVTTANNSPTTLEGSAKPLALNKTQDSSRINKKDVPQQKETAPVTTPKYATPQEGMITVDYEKK